MNLTAFGMKAIKYHLGPECTFNLFPFPPALTQAVSAPYC